MGLLNSFLYLSVLGVYRVGCIPLAPVCTPVPAAISIVSAGPVTLTSAVSPLIDMTVAVSYASMLLLFPTIQVGASTSDTALLLLSIGVGLMTFPVVFKNRI